MARAPPIPAESAEASQQQLPARSKEMRNPFRSQATRSRESGIAWEDRLVARRGRQLAIAARMERAEADRIARDGQSTADTARAYETATAWPPTLPYREVVRDQDDKWTRLTPGQQASRGAYALMDEDERVAYLADRAAEMATAGEGPNAVTGRMVLDGVAPDDVGQVVAAAGVWRENEATAEADGREVGGEVSGEEADRIQDAETGQPSESGRLGPEMTEEKIAERVAEWEVEQEEHWWESDWGRAGLEDLEPGTDPENAGGFMGAPVPGDERVEVVDIAGTMEPDGNGGYTVKASGIEHDVASSAEALALLAEHEADQGTGTWPAPYELTELPDSGRVPYELTELGAGQAVADRMTEREVGPGYLDRDLEAGS